MKKIKSISIAAFAALALFAAGDMASAQTATTSAPLHVVPFTFVDAGADCDVASMWLSESAGMMALGMTGTSSATSTSGTGATSTNSVLLLMKDCATSEVAAAGADIVSPIEGGPVSALTELDFDYMGGGHCGAGAPRFNVVVNGTTYFLGCTQGTVTGTSTATSTATSTSGTTATTTGSWTHVVFGPGAFASAGIPTSGILDDIYIIFDEGTDTPTGGSIGMAGGVLLDNISVNGMVAGDRPVARVPDDCRNGGYLSFGFRNQGQCISSIVSNRGGNAGATSPFWSMGANVQNNNVANDLNNRGAANNNGNSVNAQNGGTGAATSSGPTAFDFGPAFSFNQNTQNTPGIPNTGTSTFGVTANGTSGTSSLNGIDGTAGSGTTSINGTTNTNGTTNQSGGATNGNSAQSNPNGSFSGSGFNPLNY